jgi:hypothetical protein
VSCRFCIQGRLAWSQQVDGKALDCALASLMIAVLSRLLLGIAIPLSSRQVIVLNSSILSDHEQSLSDMVSDILENAVSSRSMALTTAWHCKREHGSTEGYPSTSICAELVISKRPTPCALGRKIVVRAPGPWERFLQQHPVPGQ